MSTCCPLLGFKACREPIEILKQAEAEALAAEPGARIMLLAFDAFSVRCCRDVWR